MPNFAELLQQSSAHAWLFVPSAILLGALHGLEPGHSKTMMAAFIVAIRGTVAQAIMLGIAATVSHTAVVWGIAFTGMYLWRGINAEAIEPYFQLLSAAIILAIAFWMLWRTVKDQRAASQAPAHHHTHDHHDHRDHHDHSHGGYHHDTGRIFAEAAGKQAGPMAHGHEGLEVAADGYQDAHEIAHANDIRHRFADRPVTNWQIVLFGLTGGLIPCPAAITVLLLCLQVKQFSLGFVLVLCFSIGLALTLVTVGAVAALSVRHASRRWTWFGTMARRAPYVSSVLIILVGLYVGIQGVEGLKARAENTSGVAPLVQNAETKP